MTTPKKHLGQHWLNDHTAIRDIAASARLSQNDTVLEIGPGQGSLTRELLKQAGKVIAVEIDSGLASKLPGQFPGKNLTVINGDIMRLDLRTLQPGYKVVANLPYYITSRVIRFLLESEYRPAKAVLLVQKEVAERIVEKNSRHSLLSVSVHVFAEAELGRLVPAGAFTPPPKVDSQVVVLTIRPRPLVNNAARKSFFGLLRAGFSSPRKMLAGNLSAWLSISKDDAAAMLLAAHIPITARPGELDTEAWLRLVKQLQ